MFGGHNQQQPTAYVPPAQSDPTHEQNFLDQLETMSPEEIRAHFAEMANEVYDFYEDNTPTGTPQRQK
jgi:hypothetical protein